ncbi:hypothetical protein [Mycobacterium deserti]|uniref:Uncharacterized protein n=1 Tax=Mycobacterium deserti TaxID=2978347 RepID=A0ABT2MDC8_9MYCO|nr:hypothetical protein [Mycobacterium deserti]MCT7659589.1 hypothetical protein [Mycobacterium deserti]
MRLSAAFFANRADVVNGMLSVDGGFWASTTVAPRSSGFSCYTVVLCDVGHDDIGHHQTLLVDAAGPTGQRWPAVQTANFLVETPMLFMRLPEMVLPIEPAGGRHVYTFRLDGQHERVDIAIDVLIGDR